MPNPMHAVCFKICILIMWLVHNAAIKSSNSSEVYIGSVHVLQDGLKNHKDGDELDHLIEQNVRANHKMYAKVHKYQEMFHHRLIDASRTAQWAKVSIIRKILRENRDVKWVMWLDSDAIFVDMSVSVHKFLEKHNIDESISLVFSGDYNNIINTGVLIVQNTPWMEYMLSEVYDIGNTTEDPTKKVIGMGSDNAAFSMFLAGCTSNNTYDELKVCYDRADAGFRDPTKQSLIVHADVEFMESIIPPHIFKHVKAVPHDALNCYNPHKAHFVAHFPGLPRGKKSTYVKEALRRVIIPPGMSMVDILKSSTHELLTEIRGK